MRLRACGWWLKVGFWLGLSGAAGAQTYHANPATLGAIPDAAGQSDGYKTVYFCRPPTRAGWRTWRFRSRWASVRAANACGTRRRHPPQLVVVP